MAVEDVDDEGSSESRRDALKKLGLGAGAVWVAPVAMSFYSPAGAAQGGSPPPTTTTTTTTTTSTTLPPPIPGCEEATCSTFVVCSSSNSDCVCVSTPVGGFCIPGSTPCSSLNVCGPNLECPPGFVCATDTCCGPAYCVSIDLLTQCPPDTAPDGARASQAARASTGAGTIGG